MEITSVKVSQCGDGLMSPRVVRMWRDEGIFVFNVYQGDEDF
jgi:hypothetical protein